MDVDTFQSESIADHESRLRILETAMVEMSTNLTSIVKVGRVALAVFAMGLGVDITGVQI